MLWNMCQHERPVPDLLDDGKRGHMVGVQIFNGEVAAVRK